MIIKSMSRKVPSFVQLLGYIDREQGQEDFSLRHNLLGRDHDSIRAEFERNAELLQKRKNGTYENGNAKVGHGSGVIISLRAA